MRVSLFVSGCTHRCEECFNPEAWDFGYGAPFGEAEMEVLPQVAAGAPGNIHLGLVGVVAGGALPLELAPAAFRRRFP